MTEEIAKNIFRIGVPLTGNPLKELNSYLIRGGDRDLLIDTGFRRDDCREALGRALEELGSKRENRDVLVTHFHSDHCGLCREAAAEDGRIYMGQAELAYMKRCLTGEILDRQNRRALAEGLSKGEIDYIHHNNPARAHMLDRIDERFTGVAVQERLRAGEYELQLIPSPGHTPGNCMVWIEKEGIMFTGDHVLFDITPNITAWPDVEDTLGDYMDSLKRALSYPVRTALPAHRKNGDYQERIRDLLAHHERRLAEVEEILGREPELTAYEITARMKWKIRARNWEEFPPVQKWFAMGECLSHLDHLIKEGKLRRENDGNAWRYSRV